MGLPRPLFVYFRSFQTQMLQIKLKASAGFELGSSEMKESTLTILPPPRPLFSNFTQETFCSSGCGDPTVSHFISTSKPLLGTKAGT